MAEPTLEEIIEYRDGLKQNIDETSRHLAELRGLLIEVEELLVKKRKEATAA